jgi:type II secretory pathway component PulC
MMRRQKPAIPWFVGALCIVLGWAIYKQVTGLSALPTPETSVSVAPGQSTEMGSPAIPSMPDRSTLAIILERPLFAQGRRPSGGSRQATSIDFTLAGVVIFGDERSALIRPAAGAIRQLKIGENVGGWTLREVALDRVIVRRDTTEAEVFLDYAAPAPQTNRTPGPRNVSKAAPADGNKDERQVNSPAAENAEVED